MKEKTIHVVCESPNRKTLKDAFSKMGISDKIIYLPIGFSINYIPKDFSDKELCFSAFSSCIRQFDFQSLYEELRKFVDTDFTKYDKVVVWHGWDADDLLLLYLMSVLVEKNLYHVDIRDCKEFMKEFMKRNPSIPYPSMGFITSDYISSFNMYSYAKPLSEEEKEDNKMQWHKWAHSSSPYRISSVKDGIIREGSVDFMDEIIIKYAKEKTQMRPFVARVMNRVLDFGIADPLIIIYKRVLELYWKGKLIINVSPCLEESANTESQ